MTRAQLLRHSGSITELEELIPDELHLVGKGANGFRALMAKADATTEPRARKLKRARRKVVGAKLLSGEIRQ